MSTGLMVDVLLQELREDRLAGDVVVAMSLGRIVKPLDEARKAWERFAAPILEDPAFPSIGREEWREVVSNLLIPTLRSGAGYFFRRSADEKVHRIADVVGHLRAHLEGPFAFEGVFPEQSTCLGLCRAAAENLHEAWLEMPARRGDETYWPEFRIRLRTFVAATPFFLMAMRMKGDGWVPRAARRPRLIAPQPLGIATDGE